MPIEKALLLKGLGVCALCAGGTVVALKWGDINSAFSSSISRKKIVWGGLECEEPTGQEGGGCSLKTGEKIFVKKKTNTTFELLNLEGGKIKVYKSEEKGENAYSENFKFLVEEGDIGTTANKLEEFETYEVKKGTETDGTNLKDQYFLSQKTDVKEEIKKALGLPWDLTDASQEQANINTESLKKIKFSDGDASISNGTVTLTIAKDTSKTDYPLGYKFTFKNTHDTNDATLKIGSETVTLKKNSPVEFKIKKEGSSLSLEKAWTLEELTKKVGLVKQDDGYWFVGNSGMNVKLGTTKKTSLPKYGTPEGRIKVYSGQGGYNEGFKFTVEKGDLTLKEDGESGTVKHPLGQFQSFEIVKEENTWYFSRKEGDEAKIKELLGLPKDNCEMPTDSATQKDCTLTGENIKKIKFDGLGGGTTATLTGTPKLTIHKDSGGVDFPLGYKFVFSSESNSTITIPTSPSLTIRDGLSIEYKIKRSGDNNQTLSLEKAWTAESLMVGAVYFDKGGDNEWVVGGKTVNVKQDTKKTTSAKGKSGSNNAKIRVYEGTPGYNQGFKFVVEDGDTDLTDGNGISKLTKYETYEVSKDDGEWYLIRKQKVEDSIKELLGLPKTCEMPTDAGTPKDCTLNGDDDSKLKAIKFEGKGSQELTTSGSGSVTVKISKESSEADFPKGYKFTFNSENKDFTIPQGSSPSLNIKKKTNTEFKIKESGNSLTLEKSLDITKLAGKLGLSGCNDTDKKCSFGSTISVWEENENYINDATVSGHEGKKISYELDQEDYNQGIKFTVEGENDIDLSGGNGSSPTKPEKICHKNGGNTPTYEIAQKTVSGNTAKWYLVKKAK